MGYNVHITRAKDWTESEEFPISVEDWLSCVGADPSVRQDPDNGPRDFLWLEHPEDPAPLWWWRGEVYSKNPDDHTMLKMFQLAQTLGAYLIGDDGEVYERRGDQLVRLPDPPERSVSPQPGFWARLFGR